MPGDPLGRWLRDAYGGKRAFLRYWMTRAWLACGGYREFSAPDFSRVERLVFVCKGNICRSAYAESRARAMGYRASSAGLEAAPGNPADPVARRVAAIHDLDLSSHRTRPLFDSPPRRGDLLVAFEPLQARRLVATCSYDSHQVTLLGLFARIPFAYVHDPYRLSDAYFSACFRRIDMGLQALSAKLPAGCRTLGP